MFPEPNPFLSSVFALLFISLAAPYLATLKFTTYGRYPMIRYLERARSLQRNFLQNLSYVSMNHGTGMWSDFDHYALLELVRFFLALPAIETIYLCGHIPPTEGRNLLVHHGSNVSKIIIGRCSIEPRCLARIVLHAKQLREFTYLGQCRYIDPAKKTKIGEICSPTLWRALLSHRRTLRRLELDGPVKCGYDESNCEHDDGDIAEAMDPPEDCDLDYSRAIGSLRGFTALRHLTIGMQLLLGKHSRVPVGCPQPASTFRLVNTLPPNLEYLCLGGCIAGFCLYCQRHFADLVENRTEWFPSLRVLDHLVSSETHLRTPDSRA
jgi:hypothetical protein